MVLLDIGDVINALGGIGILILIIILTIILLTFALQLGIKAVKGENAKLGPVFLTGLIMIMISAIVSFVFGLFLPTWVGSVVSLILELFIIKARHKTTFLGALGALIIYIIMIFVIIIILMFVFAGFLTALMALLS